ncbi:MAG: acyl-CoA dehydrogenase family protein [Gammaproteobacteria bacterium]|nr:acyl-CoA dehydrogenase family protein [Gammaproteobacteria bacterium]
MNFALTEEQLAIKELAKQFAMQEIAPFAAKWDQEQFFPVDTFRKAAELGMGGLYTKSDVGGTNLSRLESALIFEELSKACVATAAYISIHNMVCWFIDYYGSDNLRTKYLPKLTKFDYLSSYCLTEPDSGSDSANMKSIAIEKNDYYLLNGSKAFISGGSVSDIYLCMAKTPTEDKPNGISCFLIEKNTKGLSFGEKEKKLGWNCQPTTQVFFENCEIPKENMVGQKNNGFKMAMEALNGGRVNIAACSIGGADACLSQSKIYCHERKQFGQPLDKLQTLQFQLAKMATDLHAAKLVTYYAANALDHKNSQNNQEYIMHCAMAKQFASDIAFNIANSALQLHGGYGYLKEYNIERFFRDLRVHQILEGTNEIMSLVIARQLLNY